MTPKTPPGDRVCVSAWTLPQAKCERPSKKYVQSSTAATKEMLLLASGSDSQSREMTVVLRRSDLSDEGFFFLSESPSLSLCFLSSSSSSSPMISRGRWTGERFEDFEGHREPPV